jgi:hypothetical protein
VQVGLFTQKTCSRAGPLCIIHPPSRLTILFQSDGCPCKVGAGRTAALCFPTPPSEPGVPVSEHRALQGLASASGVTVGFVMFFAFAAASMILRDHRLTPTSGGTKQLIDQNIVNPLASFPL